MCLSRLVGKWGEFGDVGVIAVEVAELEQSRRVRRKIESKSSFFFSLILLIISLFSLHSLHIFFFIVISMRLTPLKPAGASFISNTLWRKLRLYLHSTADGGLVCGELFYYNVDFLALSSSSVLL